MAAVITILVLVLLKSRKVVAEVDPQGQYLTNTALAYEASQRLNTNDSIYTASSTFTPDSKPGSFLGVEAITNLTGYTVPSGLTASRFQYTTTDLDGTAVPASAYVLWPYLPYIPKNSKHGSKDSGIPLVAWAHGITGSGAPSAPSNNHNLQNPLAVPYSLALAGFAVVALDYAGHGVSDFNNGTRTTQAWLSAPSQANDLANAVIAARTAFPTLSGTFVAMGHSKAGGAAYAFAERQVESPVGGYLGTIALAPSTAPVEHIAAVHPHPNERSLTYGIDYQTRAISADSADYDKSGFSDAEKPSWYQDRTAQDSNQSLEREVHQGLEYFQLMPASQAKWVDCVKARFDGELFQEKRASSFTKLPRFKGRKQAVFANWLVSLSPK